MTAEVNSEYYVEKRTALGGGNMEEKGEEDLKVTTEQP